MKYKAIITDLDRTLLRADRKISDYTLQVLRKCREAGALLMIATGRPERGVLDYHEQLIFDAMTVSNGAVIIVPGQERVVNAVLADSAKLILERLCRLPDIVLSIEMDGAAYANVEIPEWTTNVFSDFTKLPFGKPIYKIMVSREQENIAPLVETLLTEDTYCTVAGKNLVQIMNRQATKWNGIQTMLEEFGISPEDAVYFGDDNDDIGALKGCGTGVAVANAIEAARKVADVVAGSNEEDGVAKYLERMCL